MNKRKILIASHGPSLIGGSEKSLLEIARYLHLDPKIDVTVVVPHKGELGNALNKSGIKTRVVDYRWATINPQIDAASHTDNWLAALSNIYELLKKERPSLVITNTIVIPWFAISARTLGIPHLWFIRELLSDSDYDHLYPNEEEYFRVVAASDHVFTNSVTMKQALHARLPNQVNILVPTIRDDALFHADIKQKTVNPRQPRLLVLGALSENKNQLEALRAIRLLKKQGIEPHLDIVGQPASTTYLDALHEYIKKHDLSMNVSIKAHTNQPLPLITKHDFLLVPSKFEPFGRVTVESMLLGVPVIVSSPGGGSEIVQQGKYGLNYQAGSPEQLAAKVKFALDNPTKIQQIVQLARTHAHAAFLNNNSLDLFKKSIIQYTKDAPKATNTWIDDSLFLGGRALLQARSEAYSLRCAIDRKQLKITRLNSEVARLQGGLDSIQQSSAWRILDSLRTIKAKVLALPKRRRLQL